jgi:hypothetical protein
VTNREPATEPDRAERRKAIEAALADLQPIEPGHIAHAVWIIERLLDAPYMTREHEPPLARDAADLRALAITLRKARGIAANLSPPAIEALNAERDRRGLQWRQAGNSSWSFLRHGELSDFFDAAYPQFIDVAESAAGQLDLQKRAHRPRGRKISALAAVLASSYRMITGKSPPKGRGESPFSRFVRNIFDAGGIDANAEHYAAIGADLFQQSEVE